MNKITPRDRAQHVIEHLVTHIALDMGWTASKPSSAYQSYIDSKLRLDINVLKVELITFFEEWERVQAEHEIQRDKTGGTS